MLELRKVFSRKVSLASAIEGMGIEVRREKGTNEDEISEFISRGTTSGWMRG